VIALHGTAARSRAETTRFVATPSCQLASRTDRKNFPARCHARPAPLVWVQEVTMKRWIAAILAVFNITNGLTMLFASSSWWASVPGASETGPFNLHFVQDVGAAFLTAGLALAARAWRAVYWPAALAGSGFLAAHAVIHLIKIATGHDVDAATDSAIVVLPAALALYSAFPDRGEHHA
jgi:hypothetical protein